LLGPRWTSPASQACPCGREARPLSERPGASPARWSPLKVRLEVLPPSPTSPSSFVSPARPSDSKTRRPPPSVTPSGRRLRELDAKSASNPAALSHTSPPPSPTNRGELPFDLRQISWQASSIAVLVHVSCSMIFKAGTVFFFFFSFSQGSLTGHILVRLHGAMQPI
jgi:hypothetical protein